MNFWNLKFSTSFAVFMALWLFTSPLLGTRPYNKQFRAACNLFLKDMGFSVFSTADAMTPTRREERFRELIVSIRTLQESKEPVDRDRLQFALTDLHNLLVDTAYPYFYRTGLNGDLHFSLDILNDFIRRMIGSVTSGRFDLERDVLFRSYVRSAFLKEVQRVFSKRIRRAPTQTFSFNEIDNYPSLHGVDRGRRWWRHGRGHQAQFLHHLENNPLGPEEVTQLQSIISTAINQLSLRKNYERRVHIVSRRILDGWTFEDIAFELGIKRQGAYGQFATTLEDLREILSRDSYLISHYPHLIEAWRNGETDGFLSRELD